MRGACSQGVGDSRNSAVKGPENEAVTGGGHRVVLFLKLVLYAGSGPGGQFGALGEKGVMQCP